MRLHTALRSRQLALFVVFLGGGLVSLLILPSSAVNAGQTAGQAKTADPWNATQTIQASEFAAELADKKLNPPAVVYVGFRTLYEGGHIPGASFHGTASKEEGLAELTKWAETLPRSTDLVIYCGCCPFDKCPNIRPAYTALEKMVFKNIRVLVLPNSFAKDWAEKNYPIQKGL